MEQLKKSMKAAWMAGDFGQIAKYNEAEGARFVERLQIKPAIDVLDVACGTGNTAIPAARLGAKSDWCGHRHKSAGAGAGESGE
jgi:ubiquinone/menaquinone biosynthesis C-methylase UbiE